MKVPEYLEQIYCSVLYQYEFLWEALKTCGKRIISAAERRLIGGIMFLTNRAEDGKVTVHCMYYLI